MLSILETESHSIHIFSFRSGLTLHTASYPKAWFWILFLKHAFALRVSGWDADSVVTQRHS